MVEPNKVLAIEDPVVLVVASFVVPSERDGGLLSSVIGTKRLG